MEYSWDYLNSKTYNTKVGHYKFKHEYKFIMNNGINNFTDILDIAGGSGRFALPLYNYSKSITVVDINPVALDMLKERNPDINTICSDFIQSDIQRKFSLVLCIEAIEYFEDWEIFFSKVNEILTKDGMFIFTYANPNSWRYYLRKIKHWKNGPTHYNEMSLKSLKLLLKKHNLEIVNMEGFNWLPLPLSSNSKLVLFFEFIETVFKFKYWYSQSPWLLLSISKQQNFQSKQ